MAEDKKESVDKKKTDKKDANNKTAKNNTLMWIVVMVVVIAGIVFYQQRQGSDASTEKPVSAQVNKEVTKAAEDLIKGQLVGPETKVEIKKVTQESGLYKIELSVDGQEVTSYMTKDKTKFIPQLIDIKELEETENSDAQQASAPVAEVTNKSDKPNVELFVMSYCPYGTQMEKGILPVLDVLGDKVDAKLKFVDYAMHGEKEVKENLRQYCIEKTAPDKLNDYLKCFLASKEGSEQEAQTCLANAGINKNTLDKCINETDKEFKVTELAKDKSSYVSGQFPQFNVNKQDVEKYGVQGSPTLVVNGQIVQTGRDSNSILKAICSAFNNQPEVCKKELSTESPKPGFGTGTSPSGASDSAGCGA